MYNFVKVVFAIEQLTFNDIIHNIVTNDYFTFIISATGLIGFCLTIKIERKLNNYKLIEQFNIEHKDYANAFRAHRKSIVEDNADISKFKYLIIEDLEKLRSKYKLIIGFNCHLYIYFLHRQLSREKGINKSKILNYLSKLSGILLNNKENSL